MALVYFVFFKLEKFVILEKIQCKVSGEKSEKSMKIHGSGTPNGENRVESCLYLENQRKSSKIPSRKFHICAEAPGLPVTGRALIPSPLVPSEHNR